ncbi:syntaxin-binding protein 5-like isoform X2 [Corticium candelabrum]|uniref:syntaxin-binding protein 5-like isoform X2 n=1 Tax=Corticium candelabrum TaxID=121492 RepID=UPI002E2607F9|nr:syntaxin-binding protein 5-like isoform X2 [Corticium candelabrum]
MWSMKRRLKYCSCCFSSMRVTCCCLPLQSQWLYVGTDGGNVCFVDAHSLSLSAYVIRWNRAITLQQREKPGGVVFLSEQPTDTNKILIGYRKSQAVLWDLKSQSALMRFKYSSNFYCVSWLHDGSKFVCGHSNGHLTIWTPKHEMPSDTFTVHGGQSEALSPVTHIEWLSRTDGDPMIVFAGGLLKSQHQVRRGLVTVLCDEKKVTLPLDAPVIGLGCICRQLFENEIRDPQTAVILTQDELVVHELSTPNCSNVPLAHAVNIHIPPVTCLCYNTNVAEELLADLWSIATKKRDSHTNPDQKWPFTGGKNVETDAAATNDVVVTGHVDGSARVWDASSVTLCPLVSVRISHLFQMSSDAAVSSAQAMPSSHRTVEDMLPVHQIAFFPNSRMLIIATVNSCAILCPFNTSSQEVQLKSLELIIPRVLQDIISPDVIFESSKHSHEQRLHFEERKMDLPAGFQPSLCCQLKHEIRTDSAPEISSLAYSSDFGLFAIGTVQSLSLVDVVQQQCVWSCRTKELYALGSHHLIAATPVSEASSSPLSAASSPSVEGRKSFDFFSKSRRVRAPTAPIAAAAAAATIASTEKVRQKKTKKTLSASDLQNMRLNLSPHDMTDETGVDGGKPNARDEVETISFSTAVLQKDVSSPPSHCLWIGLSSGNIICIVLQIPSSDKRLTNSVSCLQTGVVFQMKCVPIYIAVIDVEMPKSGSSSSKLGVKGTPPPEKKLLALSALTKPIHSFVVFCTDQQIKVHELPSHDRSVFKTELTKGYTYLKAKVITVKGHSCLFCLTSDGHIMIFSLPRLRLLLDKKETISVNEMRVWRTFEIGGHGQAIYMASRSELQRISVLENDGLDIPGSFCDLFTITSFPERPQKGFLKRMFTSQPQNVNREQLFGKMNPGMSAVATKLMPEASSLADAMSKAREGLGERQEKLGDLVDKTDAMRVSADEFASRARDIRNQYEQRKKKWWNPFS